MANKRKNLIDSKFLTFLPPPSLKKKVEHTFQQQQPLVIKSGQRTFNGTLINLTCLERWVPSDRRVSVKHALRN